MRSKVKNYKIFISFILLITFVFIFNSNISYARTVSFSLHDGLVTTIKDNINDDTDSDSNDDSQDDNKDEIDDDDIDNDEEIEDNKNIIKDGVYKIVCAENEKYYLDIDNNLVDNGAALQIWLDSGSPNQKFYIEHMEDGYYKIASINSAKIIDVTNADKESGTPVQQYENNDTDAQRFKIVKNDDDTYSFIAKCSGKALDITGAIYENGTKVQQYDINNSGAQKFKLQETELVNDTVNDGIISIKSAINPKMQLDMINCSAEEGNEVHLWERASTLAQRFEIHRVGENEVRIRTAASGGWLKESSNSVGSAIVQSGNSNTKASNSDTWKVEWNDGIIFVNKESGLAITIDGDINTNGTKIKASERNDSDSQRFLINIEDLIPNGYYKIQSKYGTMLNAPNNNLGTQLRTAADSASASLVFETVKYSNGYKIMSSASGWAVDVSGGSIDNAAIVHMMTDAGTTSERWVPTLQDGGYLTFKNVNSGLMLNVHLFNKEPGAEINQGLEDHSDAQLWKLVPTQLVNAYVRRNSEYYHVDASGKQTLIARNLGGWDFTDWDYVMRMKAYADANGSQTDWYATIDCDRPCRDVFFHRENGQWVAVAGYYAVQGFITLEGGSRTIPGVHTVDHKYEWSVAGPGYITSFFPHWINGVVSPDTDDAQVFHGSWARGSSGYSTHGCSAVTLEYSKWIYDNIPLGSTVHVVGNATGIPSGADPDMPSDVQVYTITDPFA